ncbi:hypothetical protein COO60DRAFT_456174 [Scenedesmus sp. NREL 46B-D3]|nr:hypothetical protein COO60DRAFT_456174 [Scenedesmus sp. NREL 46B-D3]
MCTTELAETICTCHLSRVFVWVRMTCVWLLVGGRGLVTLCYPGNSDCALGAVLAKLRMSFTLCSECDAYQVVRDRFWRLFVDFGGWQSPAVSPLGRCLADFLQQRQSSVAAFIYYCLLVRNDPAMAHAVLPSDTSASDLSAPVGRGADGADAMA